MTPTADQLALVDEGLRRAARLLGKLRPSLEGAEALAPLQPDRMTALSGAEEAALDLYLKRFQDAYESGKSLFRAGLLLAGFGWPKLSDIDLVHEAERHGVLPSAAAWLDVRDARNSAAHEYAMRPEQQAVLLNEAVRQGRVLLEQLDAAAAFVAERLSRIARSP